VAEVNAALGDALNRIKAKVAALRRYLAFEAGMSVEDMLKQLDTFVEVRRVEDIE
jgi:hypothetical protein